MHHLMRHPLAGQTIRYGLAGAFVMLVYLGLPVLFSDALSWPLQASIPVAYVLAVALQFTLQRKFVFRHVNEFALSVHSQVLWYVAVGAMQYPTTALGTFLLPKLLGISDRLAFMGTTVAFSLVFFFFIRGRVFHGSENPNQEDLARQSATRAA
jgi:putative flippase GtrA